MGRNSYKIWCESIYLKDFRCPFSESMLLTTHFITVGNFGQSFTTQFAQNIIHILAVRTKIRIGRRAECKYSKAYIWQWTECFFRVRFSGWTTQRVQSIHFTHLLEVHFAKIRPRIGSHERLWWHRYAAINKHTHNKLNSLFQVKVVFFFFPTVTHYYADVNANIIMKNYMTKAKRLMFWLACLLCKRKWLCLSHNEENLSQTNEWREEKNMRKNSIYIENADTFVVAHNFRIENEWNAIKMKWKMKFTPHNLPVCAARDFFFISTEERSKKKNKPLRETDKSENS